MRETWIIAANVFRQLLRNRILAVLTLFALALIAVVALLGDLGQEAEQRLGRDFGLFALEWVGFFTVLLCHVVLLFEETELKTYSILLVKPIERWQVILGRVLGAVLLMLMNQGGMILLLKALAWTRDLVWVDSEFLVAAAYLAVGGVLFSSVTALFSVLASSVPVAAMFATFTFILGHFTTNLVEWTQRLDSHLLKLAVHALYWVVPNYSLFNLKENLDEVGATLSLSGVFLWPVGYAFFYSGLVLAFALWRYERKDF